MRRFVETNGGEAVGGGGFRAFPCIEKNERQLLLLWSNTRPLVA